LDLTEKLALITGGSRGIGYAIAEHLGREGARVVITGRSEETLTEAADRLRAQGAEASWAIANSRRPDEISEMFERIGQEHGTLDVLVNNAATNPAMVPLVDTEDRLWDVIMDTNLKGYFLSCRHAARAMIERGTGGVILNISSVGGVTPDPGLGTYCISKAGINMLTRALARELGPHGIRVNAIAPGVVRTDFSKALWTNTELMSQEMAHTPLGRISEPEEVARLALALVSDTSSYVTGQVIVMDGGGSI